MQRSKSIFLLFYEQGDFFFNQEVELLRRNQVRRRRRPVDLHQARNNVFQLSLSLL